MKNDINKDILYLLNETEIDLDELDQNDFTDIEVKRVKKNFKKSLNNRNKKNKNFKKVAVAASVLILSVSLLASNSGGHAWASINIFVSNMASFMGLDENLDKYSTVVNKEITKDGITVKLNEVILDDKFLVVSTSFSSTEKIKDYLFSSASISINGKDISEGARGSGQGIDEYTHQEIINYNLTSVPEAGVINVKIVFDKISIDDKEYSGPWVFKFKTNGTELKKDTQALTLDKKINVSKDHKIKLDKFTSNSLGQKIYFTFDKKNINGYDMNLIGKDDLGNDVTFEFVTGNQDGGMFEYSNLDSNLNKDAKSLTLTPYAVKMPESSGKMPDQSEYKKVGEAFTIDLTKLSTNK
jgi:hypothetical protein